MLGNIKQLQTDSKMTSKRNIRSLLVWMSCYCVLDGAEYMFAPSFPFPKKNLSMVRCLPTQTQSGGTSDLENEFQPFLAHH